MRRIIKNLTLTGLSGLLCLFLAIPANAQHRGSFGGGGGGGRSSGGGGFSGGGGGAGASRQSFGGGMQGGSRQSFGGVGAGASRQSFGGGMQGGSRQSFGGGVQSAPRQSYGGRVQSTPRQSYGNVSPGVGRQSFGGRTQGLQGNTQAFGNRNTYSGRVGVNGNRGAFYGRSGGTTRISPRYYGRNFYSNGRANYGRGYSYSPWSSRSGYFYNRGYYRSSYFPRLGISLGYLPYGYYPFYWGGLQFYYSDGYFYQYDNNQYTVVEPPVGAAVNTLPSGAQSIVINGQQYYELNGVYYQPITQDNGRVVYQVAGKDGQLETDEPSINDYNGDYDGPMDYAQPNVSQDQGPQIGDVVNSLPPDTRKIKINGEKFIVSPDDYYYKETRDSNGNKVYEIVGTPTDNPGDN